MRRIIYVLIAVLLPMAISAQTLNVEVGNVTYAIPAAQAGDMVYTNGQNITILNKVYSLSEVNKMYIDDKAVADNTVDVVYNGDNATATVAGNIAQYLTVSISGADVNIVQNSSLATEITYNLSGSTSSGSFYMDGKYKTSLVLNGVSITNPNGAAINIQNGKRISVELVDGTTSTLVDGAGGSQKGCFVVKGHTEFKGGGTLNITGNTKNAFWGKEYVQLKKTVGTINILGAAGGDGFNVNQYFQMNGGNVVISGVADDGIQVSYTTDDDGNIEVDEDNTGELLIKGGSIDITTTGNASKGMKTEGTFNMSGGSVNVTQTGSITVSGDDISYCTAIKTDGDMNITGGTITINNTADGGKGLSSDGAINIDESAATVNINITANGKGGVAENTNTNPDEPAKSYKVYVAVSSTTIWKNIYLYKSDGTQVQRLTNTVTKSSGSSTLTFYYYDFKAADSDTYYFMADDYRSWSTTYTIKSGTFTGPTSGSDVYYSITNSYSTSGSTRTYTLSNVTSSYGGSSDSSEDSGTSYNAAGIKADGNITISGGTIEVKNNGEMSKSVKSKATVTINGGTITLTPSGAMKIIDNDASYSSGVKALDFIQNGGTLTINASGVAGKGVSANKTITTNGGVLNITHTGNGYKASSNATYSGKGLKADTNMQLNAGTITIKMTGTGGKGIKVNGTYTQGTSDGEGPTLSITTTGSALSSSSGGGGFGGGNSSSGGSAKAIKVMGTVTVYGGESEIYTSTNGAEGLESKTSVTIAGGKHYLQCYDDCINSSGNIYFNGGVTVCYSNGNDAVDSNAGRTGAITIGDGVIFAYTSKGSPEEGLDCDNNSYIQITGKGIAISAGGSQGGGGGGFGPGGGSSSGNTISNAAQGYYFNTSSVSFTTGRYYTLADANGNNLVTFSFKANVSSTLNLMTATGMVKGSSYNLKYSTTAPTDATTEFQGLYLGSSHKGTTNVLSSFTAQ